MKVYNAFVTTVSPELYKQELQMCLILLDLYYWNDSGVLSVYDIKTHPLATTALINKTMKVLESLNGRKLICKYQWAHTVTWENHKIEIKEPEFVLFEKLHVDGKELTIRVNEHVLEYFNKYGLMNVEPETLNELKKLNLIKLFLWFKTWEEKGITKCNVDWLKMYLDIKVETRSLNDKYIKEFLKAMKHIGIKLRTGNVYDKRLSNNIVYLLISIITKEMEEEKKLKPKSRGRVL